MRVVLGIDFGDLLAKITPLHLFNRQRSLLMTNKAAFRKRNASIFQYVLAAVFCTVDKKYVDGHEKQSAEW